ncbi:hypothetical protein AO9_00335 [Chlamydia psittaci Mat116]|nr:hypothetical protein AO9_00335 [Chlamydia psittaci Mat116]
MTEDARLTPLGVVLTDEEVGGGGGGVFGRFGPEARSGTLGISTLIPCL